LYYAFDNRPWWFRLIWKASNIIRLIISRLPAPLRWITSQIIAALVYWPCARLSYILEKAGYSVSPIPLSAYRDKSYFTMRTDAFDRFATRLEQRFTRSQITTMMEKASLEHICFSDQVPYWCAIGYKRKP
jgi:hypothetical protein